MNVLEEIPPAHAERLPLFRGSGETLQVNEIFYSIEGEGMRVGQPTTFVRLAKCNLRCRFCDTEFDRFSEYGVDDIAAEVERHPAVWVCLTGGEPLGQNIGDLCRVLSDRGYRIHIETNGTIPPDPSLYQWIEHWTVSPKCYPVVDGFRRIDELKYVVGKSFNEERVEESLAGCVYLQPESSKPEYVERALAILKRHPHWRLSNRIHKTLGLP